MKNANDQCQKVKSDRLRGANFFARSAASLWSTTPADRKGKEMAIRRFIGLGSEAATAMEMAPQNLEKTDSGDANGAVECRRRSNEENFGTEAARGTAARKRRKRANCRVRASWRLGRARPGDDG
jgi:hypothetical protein